MLSNKKIIFNLSSLLGLCLFVNVAFAQETLPKITVKNLNGKIVLSWLNVYKKPIQNILIQRSYDSLRNFSTIGTVLNPLNTENGFPDVSPPYNKMYYRLNIIFEGGQYEIGPSARPAKEVVPLEDFDITYIPETSIPKALITAPPSIKNTTSDLTPSLPKKEVNVKTEIKPVKKDKSSSLDSLTVASPKKINETVYPSNRIFVSRYNTVVIQIGETAIKKYTVKIFDEAEKLVLELKKIPEDYLILEKSNFLHSGWYRFEIYEEGIIYEKNKFYIGKDKAR